MGRKEKMTTRAMKSWLVLLLCAGAPGMLSSTAHAQTTPEEPAAQRKVKAVSADATQKAYERKAGLGASDIGLEATQLELLKIFIVQLLRQKR